MKCIIEWCFGTYCLREISWKVILQCCCLVVSRIWPGSKQEISAKVEFRYESLKSKFSFIRLVGYNLMITCSKKKLKICTRNFFWVEKKRIPDHVEKFPSYWNIKIHIISPLCDILCHIRIRQYSQFSLQWTPSGPAPCPS